MYQNFVLNHQGDKFNFNLTHLFRLQLNERFPNGTVTKVQKRWAVKWFLMMKIDFELASADSIFTKKIFYWTSSVKSALSRNNFPISVISIGNFHIFAFQEEIVLFHIVKTFYSKTVLIKSHHLKIGTFLDGAFLSKLLFCEVFSRYGTKQSFLETQMCEDFQ